MTTVNYQKWDQAVLIPVEELVFTDWNCNEMSPKRFNDLMADIEPENGGQTRFDEPAQVVPLKDSKWLVIGGEHRSKVLIGLNEDTVPCVIRWDLAGKSRQDLMLWSVRRNNLRGKINAVKYAELEAELIDTHGMAEKAARQTMLMSDGLAEALKASAAGRPKNEDKAYESSSSDAYEGSTNQAEQGKSKAELLNALRVVEQDVLLDSADTVECGYLFFVQGKNGQTHLVIDESQELHDLVGEMVSKCKEHSSTIDEFLSAAIAYELKNWD